MSKASELAQLPAKEAGDTGSLASDEPLFLREVALDNVAYLYDGTLEGLLSAVFASYERHEQPEEIVREVAYEPRLGQSSLFVPTDFEHAERVRKGVCKACGKRAFSAILRASACDDYDAGTTVYRFIRYAMKSSGMGQALPIMDDLARPEVAALFALERKVVNECEKARQFVRFSHLENGVWFAKIAPSAAVVPLVMGYFSDRLNDQPFIIFDEAHHMAGVYDGRRWQLVSGDAVNVPSASEHDMLMQQAWKRFYDALSIDARYHPELRRHFMPVRLWQNLPEMTPRVAGG